MLLPARLHTTVRPEAASASAMRLVVVVLPFVPVITTLAASVPASDASRSGSMRKAIVPGSTPPLRLKTERRPQRLTPAAVRARCVCRLDGRSKSSGRPPGGDRVGREGGGTAAAAPGWACRRHSGYGARTGA